jgi:hypothetical protein
MCRFEPFLPDRNTSLSLGGQRFLGFSTSSEQKSFDDSGVFAMSLRSPKGHVDCFLDSPKNTKLSFAAVRVYLAELAHSNIDVTALKVWRANWRRFRGCTCKPRVTDDPFYHFRVELGRAWAIRVLVLQNSLVDVRQGSCLRARAGNHRRHRERFRGFRFRPRASASPLCTPIGR